MPLIATVVIEDPLRNDGSGHCYTFFEIGDGDTLAFFEHMSLLHPKYFNARSASHRHVAFEVEGDATVQQFKRKLDAAACDLAGCRETSDTSAAVGQPSSGLSRCCAERYRRRNSEAFEPAKSRRQSSKARLVASALSASFD